MPDLVQRRKAARSAQAAPTPRSGAPRSTHAAPTPRSVRPSTVLPMSGSTPRTTPRAAWAPPCSTTTTRATRHEADPAKVKKVIEAHHRTPAELRIPFCNLDTATLELVVLPSDLVAATEVVASAVERAAARKVTVIGDVRKHNGPVSVFFRKKCNVREKTVLHALQHNDTYISMAAAKLAGVLNKALCKEALVKLELVGLQHLTEHALTLLAEGLRTNTSLSALCLNDSAIGDTGLLRIIPSLRDHKGLRRLQLCRTQMSDVAGRELMEMLGVQAERQSQSVWKHSLRTSVHKAKVDIGVSVLAISYNRLGADTLLLLASVLGLDSPLREVYARGCDLARHGGVGALPSPVLQRVLADVKMMQVLDLREATSGQGWLWDIALSPPLQIQRPPSPALDTAGSSYSDDDRDDEVTRQPLSIPLLGGVDSDGVGAVKVVVKGSTGRGVDKSAVGLRPRPSEIATQQPQFLFEEPPMKKDGKHVESVPSLAPSVLCGSERDEEEGEELAEEESEEEEALEGEENEEDEEQFVGHRVDAGIVGAHSHVHVHVPPSAPLPRCEVGRAGGRGAAARGRGAEVRNEIHRIASILGLPKRKRGTTKGRGGWTGRKSADNLLGLFVEELQRRRPLRHQPHVDAIVLDHHSPLSNEGEDYGEPELLSQIAEAVKHLSRRCLRAEHALLQKRAASPLPSPPMAAQGSVDDGVLEVLEDAIQRLTAKVRQMESERGAPTPYDPGSVLPAQPLVRSPARPARAVRGDALRGEAAGRARDDDGRDENWEVRGVFAPSGMSKLVAGRLANMWSEA